MAPSFNVERLLVSCLPNEDMVGELLTLPQGQPTSSSRFTKKEEDQMSCCFGVIEILSLQNVFFCGAADFLGPCGQLVSRADLEVR